MPNPVYRMKTFQYKGRVSVLKVAGFLVSESKNCRNISGRAPYLCQAGGDVPAVDGEESLDVDDDAAALVLLLGRFQSLQNPGGRQKDKESISKIEELKSSLSC